MTSAGAAEIGLEIHSWWHAMAEGQVAACLLGRVRPRSAARWLATARRKGRIDPEAVTLILKGAETDRVHPFLGTSTGRDRHEKLLELRDCIAAETR